MGCGLAHADVTRFHSSDRSIDEIDFMIDFHIQNLFSKIDYQAKNRFQRVQEHAALLSHLAFHSSDHAL